MRIAAKTLRRHLDIGILLAAITVVPLSAAAQRMRYERIVYPRAVTTLITGINDQGTIIGTYTLGELPPAPKGLACVPTTHTSCGSALVDAFIYAHKKYSVLRGPEGASIKLVAINNHDQILLLDSHGNKWFLYDIAKDAFTPLGMTGHLATAKGVKTIHIRNIIGFNDKGEILANADAGHVFGKPALGVAGSVTAPTELGEFTVIPGCTGGGVDISGINAQDQISGSCHLSRYTAAHVGVTALVYRDGTMQSAVEPGAIVTIATAINNSGVITGFYQPQKTSLSRSFIYDGSTFTELPVTFSPNGHLPDTIRASGINNHGQVVGTVQGGNVEGFLATPLSGAESKPSR